MESKRHCYRDECEHYAKTKKGDCGYYGVFGESKCARFLRGTKPATSSRSDCSGGLSLNKLIKEKQMNNFTLENGTKVKSMITNFVGMITARSENLHGCNRYFVQPPVTADSPEKLPEGYWFDEAELDIVEKATLKKENKDRGGFPSRLK